MSDSPIFDQLQAEFVEQSKYIRLQIGPLLGAGFYEFEVIDEHFGTIGRVHRLIEHGPAVGEGFEVVDGITKMIEVEAASVLGVSKPKLYIVEGVPEFVDLAKAIDHEPTEMEQTIIIPKFESDTPKPPSMQMLDDTQLIPSAKEDVSKKNYTNTFFDAALIGGEEKQHVFPIKKVKARTHKKNGATGTLGWFINHNRAA
jgi:hypothetical protein